MQVGLGELALIEPAEFRVSRALMCVVAAQLAAGPDFWIAANAIARTAAAVLPKALMTPPDSDQRTIDAEILAGNLALRAHGLTYHLELGRIRTSRNFGSSWWRTSFINF